jgi:hypothetical protein
MAFMVYKVSILFVYTIDLSVSLSYILHLSSLYVDISCYCIYSPWKETIVVPNLEVDPYSLAHCCASQASWILMFTALD